MGSVIAQWGSGVLTFCVVRATELKEQILLLTETQEGDNLYSFLLLSSKVHLRRSDSCLWHNCKDISSMYFLLLLMECFFQNVLT